MFRSEQASKVHGPSGADKDSYVCVQTSWLPWVASPGGKVYSKVNTHCPKWCSWIDATGKQLTQKLFSSLKIRPLTDDEKDLANTYTNNVVLFGEKSVGPACSED